MTILEQLCIYALRYALSEEAKMSEQYEEIVTTTLGALYFKVDEFSSETLKVIKEEIENKNIDGFSSEKLLRCVNRRLREIK